MFDFVVFRYSPLDPRLASLLCRSSLSCAMVAVMSHVQILETPSDAKRNYLITLHNYVACSNQPRLQELTRMLGAVQFTYEELRHHYTYLRMHYILTCKKQKMLFVKYNLVQFSREQGLSFSSLPRFSFFLSLFPKHVY